MFWFNIESKITSGFQIFLSSSPYKPTNIFPTRSKQVQ